MQNRNPKFVNCDIFCTVIDNYGDIGVCWRLARQLTREHGVFVRLWVDDLLSFAKLFPALKMELADQLCEGVTVCHWQASFAQVQPADWVIGAFACSLPESYVAAMAAQAVPPVWLNLEYLSAENWVAGCHRLPSPHPTLPLTKYFFFPGFTPDTGGLLLERDLLTERDAFLQDSWQQQQFWQSFGMAIPATDILKVSLFAYENEALPELLTAWVQGERSVLCLVPEGRIVPQLEQYFADLEGMLEVKRIAIRQGGAKPNLHSYVCGNLEVRIVPFFPQPDYDKLLWVCDVNFVRGEDSLVRAQWAGKPFVWHIYPQHDAAHQQKLQAFLDLYGVGLSSTAAQALQALWQRWNGKTRSGGEWAAFAAVRDDLEEQTRCWGASMAGNSLALNLLDFYREIGRMRAFKIEG